MMQIISIQLNFVLGYEMYHYEAIHPLALGPGSELLDGVKGTHESWVPVVNRIKNEWVQVGSQRSHCIKKYPNEQ